MPRHREQKQKVEQQVQGGVKGELMYENAWFKTEKEALLNGLQNAEYMIKFLTAERLPEVTKKVEEVKKDISKYNQQATYFRALIAV